MRDGNSQPNHSLYHDHYRRTSDGRKVTERVDKARELDTLPLAGSALRGNAAYEQHRKGAAVNARTVRVEA
jgi:hypothetical protein